MNMPDPVDEPQEFQAEISKLGQLLGITEADLLAAYDKAKKDPYVTYTIKEDVAESPVVTYLKEHSNEFRGAEVETSFLRQYPFRSLATHLLGYVGEASVDDLDQDQFADLKMGANLGKDGVERQYDSQLRGTDGKKTVEVDAAGRPKRFLENLAAKPGNNLLLTIDKELQQAAEQAIEEGIQRAHAQGNTKASGGAVVALDPNTGQVLALASYPDYDPSLWVGGMAVDKFAELKNPAAHQPFLDRAINGLYPAGSTFKPFVAAAALNAGIITKDTIFNCTGKFSLAQQTWNCWKTDGHGDLNLIAAIAQSCDVYFYNLGSLFFKQPTSVLQDGVEQFGFGPNSTGIDLPGETNGGRVPDKIWKADYYDDEIDKIWKPGDDVNLAIGQGDLLVTPLQMAVALSALANGGTLWVPKLAYRITDASGNVIHQFEPEFSGVLGMDDKKYLSPVRRGMRLVTSDHSGTAYSTFWDFPIAVAGKTGTSEKKPDDDYALFMGYAPADGNSKPQIAVVAIIEQGGHGSSVAAPVVRKVMEAFFHTETGSVTPSITD
jgi:penicillin-binding protein 2